MKLPARVPLRTLPRLVHNGGGGGASTMRPLHSTCVRAANVASVVGTGPPPEAPVTPSADSYQRVERRRRQAEMLKTAREIRNVKDGKASGGLKPRFWTNVDVRQVDDSLQVFLDQRPLRHPSTKAIIKLPLTKTHLATALALEWDHLTSAQEATKQHLIPLTSLVCRALDIEADDADASKPESSKLRTDVAHMVLRHLETDSILCWVPPAGPFDVRNDAGESLRDVQKQTADEVVSYLTTNVWPGIRIEPILDGHSLMPRDQPEGVRDVVHGWITGLDAWEVAGLERAVLAGKSLIAAVRLIAEWSEGSANACSFPVDAKPFSAEDAAKATGLEVDWQSGHWGEVEDTHDVNREDVLRQLASVVLLVSGTAKR
ncbi:ATP synthase mitochondrial F1 complex assembly factor 2 [Geosmithia morbida]|uniref:ATP synthase mitochondrial F1 complex assembly factor 2 n=1 Tax=Geosmithia morbida TaxID=1094350 RepID=A0A9P4YWU1_9HYPO|nr:ATP synthase mitochondrial F1 complex assembly factor 2 [Geosmithia morbida]KAF4124536.1 ATP synthase mitochondrial F1 complex assembly factor 2 [Geosmithia morbida]